MKKYLLLILFISFVFLRFYQLEDRMQFSWDQVQNAWAMKDLLVDGKFPLLGMAAKGSSGFYIGPAYYYLLAPFYFIFHLDPVAAGVFVGIVGIITFFTYFVFSKRIFSEIQAIIMVFLYTVSSATVVFDRTPWPVVFIPILSFLIFCFLYDVLRGRMKSLPYLALVLGFSFHVHFTSVYYLIIIVCALPIFPWRKLRPHTFVISVILFFIWFIPNIISEIQTKFAHGNNLATYIQTYYHGIHLQRIFQLAGDAFIQYEGILYFKELKILKFIIPVLFIFLLFRFEDRQKAKLLSLLTVLWFVVPWFIMSVYSGEISDYYFSISKPIAFLTISYCLYCVYRYNNKLLSIVVCILLGFYGYMNIDSFFQTTNSQLPKLRQRAIEAVKNKTPVEFKDGSPDSYLYYYYSHNVGIK